MNISETLHWIKRYNGSSICVLTATTLLIFSVFLVLPELSFVYAIELFSEDEAPFEVPYDTWVADYWNWWLGTSIDEATPKQDGCLMNATGSIVMLMETADTTSAHQKCDISSTQGIMVPTWIAWCSTGDPGHENDSDEQLTKCAREGSNLGNIRSDVKVDGVPIAKLDVKMSMISGSLDYTINSLTNITELYQKKGFDLTVPADTHKANVPPGEFRSGAHGWFVFLKPLPPGEHTISYNVRVTPTGAITSPGTNPHFADIEYLFNVK